MDTGSRCVPTVTDSGGGFCSFVLNKNPNGTIQ